MEATTVTPIFVKYMLHGAIEKGYNPEEILAVQGIPPQLLSNPNIRISTIALAKLTHAVTDLLRDESYGAMAKPQQLGTFKTLAHACLSTDTVAESLAMWRDANNLMDTCISVRTSFSKNTNYVSIDCQENPNLPTTYVNASILTSCHRFHCWLAKEFIPIEKVELTGPEPEYSQEYSFMFYGSPVHYNQTRNAIYFDTESLQLKNNQDKASLRQLLESHHTKLLTQPRQSNSIAVKVRLWMERCLREDLGNPQLDKAAEHLGMTEQTLRRHLKKNGYSFQTLKDDTRRDMAILLMQNTQMDIEEIAFKLCFSESSTFIRAFKKWTGLTPLAYRKL